VREDEHFYRIVGAPFASDWVQYNVELGTYDVQCTRNDSYSVRQGKRDVYRMQIQGKNEIALELMRRLTNGSLPEIKCFHVGEIEIAGRKVRALRHGMAGEVGFELYGPWEDQDAIRTTIMQMGADLGLRKVGALAYPISGTESAWLAMPLPAIYHGVPSRNDRFSRWQFCIGEHRDIVDPIELGGFVTGTGFWPGRSRSARRISSVKRTLNEQDTLQAMRDSMFPHGATPPATSICRRCTRRFWPIQSSQAGTSARDGPRTRQCGRSVLALSIAACRAWDQVTFL
jgi:hypothetical protein